MNASRSADRGANLPRFQRTQLDFAAHIRNPELHPRPADVESRRMQVYVDLFYANVESMLARAFPVAKGVLGEERWHAMVRDFLHRHVCESHIYMEIPREFLAYLDEERDGADDPPFLAELCHYEWVELALEIAPDEVDWERPEREGVDPDGDLLEGLPVVSPLAWSLGYRWPVHEIGPEHVPAEPPAQPTWLIVYRDRHDRVGFMASNAVTARLLELLEAGEAASGRDAVGRVAGELGRPAAEIVDHGARALEHLRARDVILGTRLSERA